MFKLLSLLPALALLTAPASLAATGDGEGSAHDFEFTSIEGEALPLSRFEGQVLLVVNTASLCGFTPQYEGLQSLWERYRDQGLVVLGVPSNDFGGQEPGTREEIAHFCTVNFDIDFPMTDKVSVKGPNTHPFYRWIGENLGKNAVPRWNFHKYLIDAKGRVTGGFSSRVTPEDARFNEEIRKLLASVTVL